MVILSMVICGLRYDHHGKYVANGGIRGMSDVREHRHDFVRKQDL